MNDTWLFQITEMEESNGVFWNLEEDGLYLTVIYAGSGKLTTNSRQRGKCETLI